MLHNSDSESYSVQDETSFDEIDSDNPLYSVYKSDFDPSQAEENFSVSVNWARNPYDNPLEISDMPAYVVHYNVYVQYPSEKRFSEKKDVENKIKNYIS